MRSSTWPLEEPAPLGGAPSEGAPGDQQQQQQHHHHHHHQQHHQGQVIVVGVKSETPECESPIPPQPKSEPSNKKMRNAWGNMSYAELITQAILSTPEKRLTLSEIYDWIVKNVHYFSDKANSPSTAGWKVKLASIGK